MPRLLQEFEGQHRGRKFILTGNGGSISNWERPLGVIVIAITDSEQHYADAPDYLLMTDAKERFDGDSRTRFKSISNTLSVVQFLTDYALPSWEPHLENPCTFKLGQDGHGEPCDGESLGYSKTSFFPAALLAEYMGAERVGMIGIDCWDHPNLSWRLPLLNDHFKRLSDNMISRGCPLFNLSSESAILRSSVPNITMDQFLRTQ